MTAARPRSGTLVRAEELEARREQRVDPGRDGDVVEVAHGHPATVERLQLAIVDEHRDQLLDEEGVALGATRDVIPDLREALRLAEQLRDQAVAGGIVQRLEPHDRAGAGARAVPPFREPLEQLGAAGAEQDDRDRLGVAREVLDQLEQRCLGPLRIVEQDDERDARRRGSRTAVGPPRSPPRRRRSSPSGRVIWAIVSAIEWASSSGGSSASIRATLSPGPSSSWIPAACLTIWASGQNVMPSPYGRHLPRSTVARPSSGLHELVRQSRFADARASDDGDEAAVALGLRSLQHPFELGQGIPAADEWSVESRGCIRSLAEGQQAVGTDRVALALQLEGCQPLGVDRIAHEPVRRLGEEDLARLRVLLEAGRRVGRVAGNEVAIGNEALSGDRPRVQARSASRG